MGEILLYMSMFDAYTIFMGIVDLVCALSIGLAIIEVSFQNFICYNKYMLFPFNFTDTNINFQLFMDIL